MSGYKGKTPYLNIPVVQFGDKINPDMEMRKYTIIENMLIAGTQGVKEVVFDEGSYSLDEDGDVFVVSLRAGSTHPSIHGMVSGFYFKGASTLKWESLIPGNFYYLYIRPTPNTPHENSAIRTVASKIKFDAGSLLVGTVDLRNNLAELDTNPDGKIYSGDIARHAADSFNPHGTTLTQEILKITKSLVIDEFASVEVGGSELSGGDFVAAVATLTGKRVEVIDFVSGGVSGVPLKASGKIVNVQVHRRIVGTVQLNKIGEVGIGYFGEDNNVDSESECMIYNSHVDGIPMRALVITG